MIKYQIVYKDGTEVLKEFVDMEDFVDYLLQHGKIIRSMIRVFDN